MSVTAISQASVARYNYVNAISEAKAVSGRKVEAKQQDVKLNETKVTISAEAKKLLANHEERMKDQRGAEDYQSRSVVVVA